MTPKALSREELEEEFYVCPHHQTTGGYESCCECEPDESGRLCTEFLLTKENK